MSLNNEHYTLHRTRRVYPGHHTAKGSRQTVAVSTHSTQNRGAHASAVVGHQNGAVATVNDNNGIQDGRADVTGL